MSEPDAAEQKQYFDIKKHQYSPEAIAKPSLHTRLEIQHILDELKANKVVGPIIDFGSGTGRLSIPLAQAGYSVLSVDVSDSSLKALSRIANRLNLSGIQTSLEFPRTGTFGAVVGADILHHIDFDEYLPRIYDVLPSGGPAIFSEPGGMNIAWYIYLPVVHDMKVERRIVYCNLRTLQKKFKEYRFRHLQIAGLGLLPRPLFAWSEAFCRVHDATGNWPLLKWFAYRYIVAATK